MNTAYALFDKSNERITFKYNTIMTSNLNVDGLSTLSNLSIPNVATIKTLNATTASLSNLSGSIATFSNLNVVQTANTSNLIATTASLSNLTGRTATLSNLTVSQTATLSNISGTVGTIGTLNSTTVTATTLNATTANLTNIITTGSQLQATGGDYRIYLNQANAVFKVANASFGGITLDGTNFGVGTSTPSDRLDVNGNITYSGIVYSDKNNATHTTTTTNFSGYWWAVSTDKTLMTISTAGYYELVASRRFATNGVPESYYSRKFLIEYVSPTQFAIYDLAGADTTFVIGDTSLASFDVNSPHRINIEMSGGSLVVKGSFTRRLGTTQPTNTFTWETMCSIMKQASY